MGIIAHYTNEDGDLQHSVLGLRGITETHTGENMVVTFIDALQSYGIAKKIGYGMMDNATNKDRMWLVVGNYRQEFGIEWDHIEHRLRCNSHIINLLVKASIFSHENLPSDTIEKAEQQAWRKYGPLDKAHNLILHVRHNPQRQHQFMERSGSLLPHRDNYT